MITLPKALHDSMEGASKPCSVAVTFGLYGMRLSITGLPRSSAMSWSASSLLSFTPFSSTYSIMRPSWLPECRDTLFKWSSSASINSCRGHCLAAGTIFERSSCDGACSDSATRTSGCSRVSFFSAGATPTVDTVTPFFRKAKWKGSHKCVTAAETL